ncbi:hypothetical protein D3C73_1310630 [compost metagenome]
MNDRRLDQRNVDDVRNRRRAINIRQVRLFFVARQVGVGERRYLKLVAVAGLHPSEVSGKLSVHLIVRRDFILNRSACMCDPVAGRLTIVTDLVGIRQRRHDRIAIGII